MPCAAMTSKNMAPSFSFVQKCCMRFHEKSLTGAIWFEAESGYRNAFGQRMRFSSFLHSNLLKLCSRSNHANAKKLLEEVNGYGTASMSDRSKLLNKVSELMGYSSVQDLIEHERYKKLSASEWAEMIDESCRKFTTIILGDSTFIELYKDKSENVGLLGENYENYLSGAIDKSTIMEKDDKSWTRQTFLMKSLKDDYCMLPSSSLPIEEHIERDEQLIPEEIMPPSMVTNPSLPLGIDVEVNLPKDYGCKSVQIKTLEDLSLDKPISTVYGLSTRHRNLLDKAGFYTVRKLLQHFPRTYADLKNAQGVVDDGQYLMFVGRVLSSRGIKAGSSFSFVEVIVDCEIANSEEASAAERDDTDNGEIQRVYLHLKKYFRGTRFTSLPFLKKLESKHKEGDLVYVSGKVKAMKKENHFEMREYAIDMLGEEEESCVQGERRPYPLYPSKSGLSPIFLRDIILRILRASSTIIDPIPEDIRKEFGLLSLYDSYLGIHQPKNIEEADSARRRLIFDEFFYLQLDKLFQMLAALGSGIEKDALLEKYMKHEATSVPVDKWSCLTKKLFNILPYALTSGQLNAISEIIWDLRRPIPMNRLLQGDVGCGKTIVAFLACMEVMDSGYQAAFMVPTELLATQHYEHFLSLLEKLGGENSRPSVALLTGSTPSKQSRLIREGLRSGEIALVIGTHSLISDNVEFGALRIAVVDEQHRFGVIQRGKFTSKLYSSSLSTMESTVSSEELLSGRTFMAPHVLALSATPIPRTLALALYGDMSLTQIRDLPPGRKAIETYIFEGNDSGLVNVHKMMLDELQAGGKVYLVFPIIEESEQLPQLHAASADFESISSKFEGYQCGLVHGRLKSDEKEEALKKFRTGETRVLFSTQVIEIGVDVPDASMMVVMNAERFGLAQLHQLRGRVGRGSRKSKCIFVSSTSGALHRLKVLEKSSDGFNLANVDLNHRGPGDLLGKKQSGHLPEFPITRLEIDGNILQEAHLAALKVLSVSHDLERYSKLKAELSMRHPLCVLGD